MRTVILAIGLVAALSPALSSHSIIIPPPAHMVAGEGGYAISPDTLPGFELSSLPQWAGWARQFVVEPSFTLPPEGYRLTITADSIALQAPTQASLLHAAATLRQLAEANNSSLPECEITDYPLLPWRGVMLDLSRNYLGPEFVRRQIDAAADLKLNRLHLHLTDAAGWRLEIKQYPLLTSKGAFRKGKTWEEWQTAGRQYLEEGAPGAEGGYLTQGQARYLVEYASQRGITLVPEIEMPGHSEEVTWAYPGLACVGASVPSADLCPGNPMTYEFMENVLREVMDVFPSDVIHVGGDEASGDSWSRCTRCARLMAEKGITDHHQLQGVLIDSIGRFLASLGRRLMGWDEIMNSSPGGEHIVQVWRGYAGPYSPSMVLSPGNIAYLDAYQDAPASQPRAIGGYLPWSRCLDLSDTIASLSDKPLGVEACLWGEYVPTAEHAEYMLYPRLAAIAEVGWGTATQQGLDEYSRRMRRHGYNAFDLDTEKGQRPEACEPLCHQALGAPVYYLTRPWGRYPGANGASTLTDGLGGGWTYGDGRWQAFLTRGSLRPALDVIMKRPEKASEPGHGEKCTLDISFMQLTGPGVWLPERVEVLLAPGFSGPWQKVAETAIEPSDQSPQVPVFKRFHFDVLVPVGNYIRLKAYGSQGVLFTDEILINASTYGEL